jgi:dethiobiotin synthetase
MSKPPPGLFVTGTNTAVGKTYVAAMIARDLRLQGYRVGVYKPAASGCRREGHELVADDALELWNAAGRPGELARVCPQCFELMLAPHLAAIDQGQTIDPALLRSGIEYWRERSDVIVVEGAGGLMSPLGDDEYNADLAHDLGYPLVVVTRNALGTIHETLTTLIAAAAYGEGLDVAGLVLNSPFPSRDDSSIASNRAELEARAVADVLAEVHHGGSDFDRSIDWFSLSR